MLHGAHRLIAGALVLVACANTSDGAATPARDAGADSEARDAAADSEARDAAVVRDASDGAPADGSVAPGPIDGAWRVVNILCDNQPASAAARLFITAPNSSSFVVRGARSTYTLITSTCTQRLESEVTYPSPGRAVFTAAGPFSCTPALCSSACGTTPAIAYVYQYERRGDGLVMTTVGPTPDLTCTAYGQANPIRYTYDPVP